MSYKISYSPNMNHKYPPKTNRDAASTRVIAIFLLIAIMVLLCLPSVRLALKEFLIPGDPETTRAAFSNLVENVREGNNITAAIEIFCLEIVNEGAAE